MIVIYAIAATVIGSFLAHLSFGIPGYVNKCQDIHRSLTTLGWSYFSSSSHSLNKQIDALNKIKAELQTQIVNLTVQVDELTFQVCSSTIFILLLVVLESAHLSPKLFVYWFIRWTVSIMELSI
jgi:predicted PurR-regulated permease PerM